MSSSNSSSQIYSQPSLTGSGTHESAQLAIAIDALKANPNPVRLEDFALSNALPTLLDPSSSLFRRFQAHDRVLHDPRTDLWTYKPDFDLHSPSDLVTLLKQRYTHPGSGSSKSTSAGMKLSELRESYPAAREAIEELCKHQPHEEREVLVLRGQKDNAIKQVFWNPLRGAEARPIDEEFKTLWHDLKVPDLVDLPKELEKEGLSTTDMLDAPIPASGLGAKKKKGKKTPGQRRFKLQNTHLEGIDLSTDFIKR